MYGAGWLQRRRPAKAAEAAKFGGPAYGLKEAESDVVSSAAGAFALHGASELLGPLGGGSCPRRWMRPQTRRRRLTTLLARLAAHPAAEGFPAVTPDNVVDAEFTPVEPPAALPAPGPAPARLALPAPDDVRGAAQVVDKVAAADTATGPLRDGGDYDAAQAALARGEAPAMPEPTQDPTTLLTDDDPQTGPAAESPPVAPGVQVGDATTYRGRAIYSASFDPAVVQADPATFQYKAGGDAAGVTDRLRGVQTWDPTSAGRAMVYEDAGGGYTVADGHQRLALAKRLSGPDTFTTSKGSSYVLHEDGTTTRDKAARPEHPGEEGAQPRSHQTFYVDDEGLQRLGTFQGQGQGRLTMVRRGPKAAVRFEEGQFAGKFDQHSLADVHDQPAAGLYPVELWNNGSRVHFGNAITDVRKGQSPTLDALLFRQADGWSAQDVRTMAALKNIREGSGTPLDAAKVLRDHPEALNDDSLPVTGALAEQGRGLARLSDDAFGAVVNEVVPQHHAALIGNMAGDRPDLHAGMIDLLHRGKPANGDEARALVSEALEADWRAGEGAQADMFGTAPQSGIIARAKVKAAVLRQVRADAKLFSTLTRQADAIEAGGNALARSANEASLATNRAAEALITKLSYRDGAVGAAMRAAADEVDRGAKPADAARKVADEVRRAIGDADAAERLRDVHFTPDPPSPAAEARAADFAEPGGAGQREQLNAKPEEAEAEGAARAGGAFPGLFDDIRAEANPARAAVERLAPCAPGGGE